MKLFTKSGEPATRKQQVLFWLTITFLFIASVVSLIMWVEQSGIVSYTAPVIIEVMK